MKTLVKRSTGVYQARIRINAKDKITYVSLRTKDPLVAQKKIDELYTQMEREAAGIISSKKMKDAAESYLLDLVKKYCRTLEAGYRHTVATESRLKRLCKDCDWKRVRDIDALDFQEWRARQGQYTPKTKNHYLSSLNAFCTWLLENGLTLINAVENLKPVKKRGRQSFIYRALSIPELTNLLKTSKRSEIYHFAAMTGFRHAEVSAFTWADIRLNDEFPFVILAADKTKNGKEAPMKLHSELLELLQNLRPKNFKENDLVFRYMPDNRTVKRDFEKAGITTNNTRGEKASFHSLRKTFCTMMHNAGVPQRIAQEAMRHGSAELTNDVYTDRNLLAVGSAIDALPFLAEKVTLKQALNEKVNVMNTGQSLMNPDLMNIQNMTQSLGEKETENPVVEALRVLKEWCTRMESNHHAVAGTRT